MRIASRVIGAVLAFTGLSFLALGILVLTGSLDRRSVLEDGSPSLQEWAASGFAAAIGVGLILVGWYYLRTSPDGEESPKAPSRADLYIATHRREFAVLAEAGFLMSGARLGATSIGIEWPGKWAG